MQTKVNFNTVNFNTEKHAQLHMNLHDVCPKCGEHSLQVGSKKEGSHCKNSFCGYRTGGRTMRRSWNVM